MLFKIMCFLAPVSIVFQIDIGSQVFAAEIIIPCLASIIVLSKKKIHFSHDIRLMIKFALAYFAAQIISDLWNQSDFDQYSRGWARIILFLANIVAIYIIIGNRRSHLVLFCLGFALGRFWITYTGFEGDGIPWKIGLAKPVALALIVICIVTPIFRGRHAYLAALILLALGVFDIVMDFRSHGAVLIVVAVILMSSAFLRQQTSNRGAAGLKPFLGLSITSLIAMFAAYQIYVYAADAGWLSENANRKFETQVRQADVPLIVAGRSELLVYFEAIFGSIIVGHGSWPRDQYYAEQLATARVEKGLSKSPVASADNSIPIHSHIFGSWIEAGILGGLFWFNIIILIVKSLIKSGAGISSMRPLYLYGAALLLWDIFFSPFSGFRRLETAFLIVVVLRSLLQRQKSVRARTKGRRRRRRRRRQSGSGGIAMGGDVAHPA